MQVFGFSIQRHDTYEYDWSQLTTVAWNTDPQLLCTAHRHGARVVLNANVANTSFLANTTSRKLWVCIMGSTSSTKICPLQHVQSQPVSMLYWWRHGIQCRGYSQLLSTDAKHRCGPAQVEQQLKMAVEQHLDGTNFDMEVPIRVRAWLVPRLFRDSISSVTVAKVHLLCGSCRQVARGHAMCYQHAMGLASTVIIPQMKAKCV